MQLIFATYRGVSGSEGVPAQHEGCDVMAMHVLHSVLHAGLKTDTESPKCAGHCLRRTMFGTLDSTRLLGSWPVSFCSATLRIPAYYFEGIVQNRLSLTDCL